MPHAIWRGSITFGLVTVPVSIVPAEDASANLSFHLLDGRDFSPVHQKRVNSVTGDEVPWDDVVKGYQLPNGSWVVVTEDDMRAANVEATQTIDVLAAVCADEIDPKYFDKPYFLEPARTGRKAYALLRDALRDAGRFALCTVVIRTRQHLAALVPDGDAILLELLRYPHELRSAADLDLPPADLAASGVTDAEVAMAKQLLAAIEKPFDPGAEEYRDRYRDDLLALIERKAAGGEVATAPEPTDGVGGEQGGEVVDIVELLRRSLEQASRQGA